MKQTILILSLVAGFLACNKNDDKNPKEDPYQCTTCIQSPEAKAEYDVSSAGVYKGILVGSTGTIALYLYNTGTEVKALVSFDGKSGTLTCATLGSWIPGQAISNALFTGTIDNEQVSATFSVDANGQNPQVTVQIPGHDVHVAVYKETSSALIRSFEGTYSGDNSGIFNMVFTGDDFTLISDGDGDPVSGTVVNGTIHLEFNGTTVDGAMEGSDAISGTWVDSNSGKSGTWSAQRTL
jgi:VCBS repeat-containing protein